MLFAQKKALARAQELYARRFPEMTDITPLDAMDAASEGVHAAAPETVGCLLPLLAETAFPEELILNDKPREFLRYLSIDEGFAL